MWPWNQKTITSWQETLTVCWKEETLLCHKGLYSQGYGLPSGHIQLWELDRKEGRTPKHWSLQTVVLEKTTESPLDGKEIKPVNLKGDQLWIFTGRTDAEAEVPVLWSSDVNWQLIGNKSLMLGKIGSRRRRRHQRMRWLDGIIDTMNMNLGKLQEMMRDREAWRASIHGVAKSQAWLGNWTTTLWYCDFWKQCLFDLWPCYRHRDPKTLVNYKKWWAIKMSYVNEMTFGIHLNMGVGDQYNWTSN